MINLDYKSSLIGFQFFDENKILIGEFVYGLITGWKEKFIIDNKIYTLHYKGFLWNDMYVLDQYENKIIQLEFGKNRIFFYGEFAKIYHFKIIGGFSHQLHLFDKEEILVKIVISSKFLKTRYTIEISENLKDPLLILLALKLSLKE